MRIAGHRRLSLTKGGSADESRPSSTGEDETEIEPDQGNVLSHIISQLRPGADLSRVTLPTFILEPRSMLERITNFMAHPENLLPLPEIADPIDRFVAVLKFYLSGWHIRPPGVKKPLNPILGEIFTCYWDYPDKTRGYYISEQTSHHPPKSSYFYMAPEHNIRIDGTLKPRSRFLGNSAASLMEGIAILRLMNVGKTAGGEKYFLTQPNMYARGILFGKMKYELGDHSVIRCPENHLSADVEFKTKGYFGGTYNAIGGTIKNDQTGEVLYELGGMWNGEMTIKNMLTGHKEVLWNATNAKHSPPQARPIEEQEERESQRLWQATVIAIKASDHTAATDEKTKIEERQREEAAKRQQAGQEWHPRLFRPIHGGPGGPEEGEEQLDWILDATIDGKTPAEKVSQILEIAPILPGQRPSARRATRSLPSSQQIQLPHQSLDGAASEEQHPINGDGSGGDLIDFGDSSSSAPMPPPVQQQQQQQQQISPAPADSVPASTGSSNSAMLAELHQSQSNDPVATRGIIKRTVTGTNEVDVFADAQQ